MWAVLVAMSIGALAYVAAFASPLPTWDYWDVVPAMTGHEPITVEWLFALHNEHRIPLPKLAWVALARATGDLRAVLVLGVAALTASTALLVLAARRLRGRASIVDAALPLATLHVGQYELLQAGFHFQMAASASIALALLALLATASAAPPGRVALGFGAGLLALPLCGANGALMVPALALFAALLAWRARSARPIAFAAAALAALALLFALGSLVGAAPDAGPGREASALLRSFAQFLTISLGPVAVAPLGESGWPVLLPLLLAGLGAAASLLAASRRASDERRLLATGLGLFAAAIFSLAAAVAFGRSASGPLAGAENRYTTLAAPLVCAVVLAMVAGSERPWGRRVAYATALTLAALALLNTLVGVDAGARRRAYLAPVLSELRAGVPLEQVARAHAARLHPAHSPDWIADRMRMLAGAGIRPFDAPTAE